MTLLSQNTFLRHNLALDVGTAYIRMGTGAHRLIEAPSVAGTKHALSGGVVVDSEALVTILKPLLAQGRAFGIVKPRVLTCAPSGVNRTERDLLVESIIESGASSVVVIPELLAAAIGAGVDVSSPYAQMVIDIGEGVIDCAVIQSSKIGATCALRVGCARMRAAIMLASLQNGEVTLSDEEADELLRTRGVSHSRAGGQSPAQAEPSLFAVEPVLKTMTDTVADFLRELPPPVGCEVIESGIWLTGGGALIPGMRERLQEETGIGVTVVGNPRVAVVEGARIIMPVVTALNQW